MRGRRVRWFTVLGTAIRVRALVETDERAFEDVASSRTWTGRVWHSDLRPQTRLCDADTIWNVGSVRYDAGDVGARSAAVTCYAAGAVVRVVPVPVRPGHGFSVGFDGGFG